MDSAVPLARNHFGSANPARCAGLISGIAPRGVPGARLSQPQRVISPTAFDKFYPVMSGEGAAGEDTRAPFFALKNPCASVSIRG